MEVKSCILGTKQEMTRLSVCRVTELTVHLLFNILSQLPMETIFSCRCVCKQFLNILTDPYFAKLHQSKAPKSDYSLIVQESYYPSESSLTYNYDLEKIPFCTSSNSDHRSHSSLWRNLTIPDIISNANEKYIASLAGSCNGLICISYAKEGLTIFYICNPILAEFIRLPKHNPSDYHGAAFGFCENTKQYKVVRFINTSTCEIHSLGTDYWRRIENVPYPINIHSFDSSLNGNLHWVTTNLSTSKLICSLNLETETFHYTSPPPHFNESDTKRRISSIRAGEIGGLFSVFYVVDGTRFEVCVMKEYGVQASWTKEFSVDVIISYFERHLFHLIPLRLLSNGDLLFRHSFVNLIHYSFQKGTIKKLITQGCCDVVCHVPSFLSLKQIVGDKNVEVVRRNKSVRTS